MQRQCPPNTFSYTFDAGDTLYSLASRYNTTVSALVSTNPEINPDNLKVGQQICIPVTTPPVNCPEDARSYTIQAGDTFYNIARRFSISVDELIQLNPGVNPDALLVGQKICVPGFA